MGSYCNETDIEAITQFDIDATTNPNTTEVAAWITQIEADVDARCLYTYSVTDELVDVLPQIGFPPKNTMAWLRSIARERYDTIVIPNIVVLPRLPIISISSLSRRTSSLGSTDVWESLDEGTSSGDSFIILKKRTKTNQYLGFGVYFHDNAPYNGPQRLKVSYNYGWNLSSSIIGEWCALKVSLKVLDAVMNATTPIGTSDYGVQDVRVGIDPTRRRKDIIERIREIEDQYFPTKKLGIALF